MPIHFHIRVLMIAGVLTFFSGVSLAQQVDLMLSGQKAFSEKKFVEAEKIFSEVVEKAPDDHKALRALAETKVKLKKFVEAESLVDRILKMPAVKGRNV